MVGDYISTSFDPGGLATTVFAIGLPPSGKQAFNEAMQAPSSPLAVATAIAANRVATSSGVQATGGTGQGALLQSIRHN